MGKTKLQIEVDRRTGEILRAIGDEVRHQREDAGLSQAALARAAGISAGLVSRVEAADLEPSIRTMTALARALGGDLSVKLYPGTGPALRDRIQARMVERLLSDLHPRWHRFVEVPVHRPVRGVIDVVIGNRDGLLVAVEAQSDLRRLEQQVRWAAEKAEALADTDVARFAAGPDGSPVMISRLMLLRSSRRMRDLAREFPVTLATAYPAPTVEVVAALTAADRPWPGAGIAWVSVDGRESRLMPTPPRGVPLGR